MPICDWTEIELTQKWCEEKLISSITDLGGLESVPSFAQAIYCIAYQKDVEKTALMKT